MDADELRGRLQDAGARRARAIAARDAASEDLRRLIVQALDADISVSEIARITSLSREGVYKLSGRRDSS